MSASAIGDRQPPKDAAGRAMRCPCRRSRRPEDVVGGS